MAKIQTFSIRLPQKLVERIDKAAKEVARSRNNYLEQFLGLHFPERTEEEVDEDMQQVQS